MQRLLAAVGAGTVVASGDSNPNSTQPTDENKIDVEQNDAMNAYVKFFRETTQGQTMLEENRLRDDFNPYKDWIIDSRRGFFGWGRTKSKMKIATDALKAEFPNNPFYCMIDAYLNRHGLKNEHEIKPVIKHLVKFILDGMTYIFLLIECRLKEDSKERIKHYKIMLELCSELSTHSNWDLGEPIWQRLSSSHDGAQLSSFLQELILKVSSQIQKDSLEAKPGQLNSHVAMLEEHLKNVLASSQEILLLLTSNEPIPKDIFHDDRLITALQTKDHHYFSTSSNIPKDIRAFLGNENRLRFLVTQFFSPTLGSILKKIDSLAKSNAHQDIAQRHLKYDEEKGFLSYQPQEDKIEDTPESKKNTLSIATLTSSALTNPDSSSTHNQLSFNERQLQEDYGTFLEKQNISFQEYLPDTVPPEIKEALVTSSQTDSVIQAKHDQAMAFLRVVTELHTITQHLSKDYLLASSIRQLTSRDSLISPLSIEGDFQPLAQDLRALDPHLKLTFDIIGLASLDLRKEISSLGTKKSTWAKNVSLALKRYRYMLKLFGKIMPLLHDIQTDLNFITTYEKLLDTVVHRRKVVLMNMVLNGIYTSKSFIDRGLEQLVHITFTAAQLKKQLSQPGQQSNDFYLKHIQHPALMPPGRSRTGELEISSNDLETAILTQHGLTLGQAFRYHIPLSQSARDWLQAKYKPTAHRIIEITEEDQLQPASSTSPVPSETKPAASTQTYDFNKQNQQRINSRINQLTQGNKLLTAEIANLQLQQQLKNRRQDFSFRIFKPSWWWITGIGFIVHCILMLGAAIYRLVNRNTIKRDLRDYQQCDTTITRAQALRTNNNRTIEALRSQLQNRTQQREVKPQPLSSAPIRAEEKGSKQNSRIMPSAPQTAPKAMPNNNTQNPTTSIADSKTAPLGKHSLFPSASTKEKESKPSSTIATPALSPAEFDAMTEKNAILLAANLLHKLRSSAKLDGVKAALSKSNNNLTTEVTALFDKSFSQLPEARTIQHPETRRVIYQTTIAVLAQDHSHTARRHL